VLLPLVNRAIPPLSIYDWYESIFPLYCNEDVFTAMLSAWAKSANGTSGNEAGFSMGGDPISYSLIEKASDNTKNTNTMPVVRTGTKKTFVIFHVHPNSSTKYASTPNNNALGDPEKSDTYQAAQLGARFFIMHRTGLTVYDPKTGTNTDIANNLD
jgi:hypothetical protein